MVNSKLYTSKKHIIYFNMFQQGNEKGLDFYYHHLYPSIYYYGFRYIKDAVNADCIVNEAFLRLWISRKIITEASQIETFLRKLTSDACKTYFKTSKNRFHRNMLRLDELENYQEFITGEDPRIEEELDTYFFDEDDLQTKQQWEKVEAVIPSLNADQQMFIRLCIKYAFDYGRIAWHIGGISDYQVAIKVEQTLESLKAILINSQKLDIVSNTNKFKFEGDVCEQQAAILHMRYQLQYSFEEIAKSLNLEQGYIQQAFVKAALKIKKIKI